MAYGCPSSSAALTVLIGERAVVGMDVLEVRRVGEASDLLPFEPEDPVQLVRPPDDVAADVPLPASDVCESLSLAQP